MVILYRIRNNKVEKGKLDEPEKYRRATYDSESGIGESLILILLGKEPGRILFKNHPFKKGHFLVFKESPVI